MAAGYFNDGSVQLELGAHVFATPSGGRRNVVLERAGQSAVVLASGAGVLALQVTAQRLRANLGDAERYIYEKLRALAESEGGDLGFEDNRGHRHVFGDAVCLGAAGEVHGFRFAQARYEFACPEKSSEPAWGSVPSAPGTYWSASTLQDYAAGGVDLGTGERMRIEMSRRYPLIEIPRARGARARGPASGALIRFTVTAARKVGAENLATDVEDLIRQIGPGPVDLTANGNTYTDVLLDSVRPRHTDARHTTLDFEFLQDIGQGTVMAAMTTTTTLAP